MRRNALLMGIGLIGAATIAACESTRPGETRTLECRESDGDPWSGGGRAPASAPASAPTAGETSVSSFSGYDFAEGRDRCETPTTAGPRQRVVAPAGNLRAGEVNDNEKIDDYLTYFKAYPDRNVR